mmetsp:Transcript_12325/g.31045  ORF Transcript_12325/g.31045 Transcript_12325/m.31045 type:complete len:544 (+) Transcript_12325:87-1718(+)
MADQNVSNIGRDVDVAANPGESMRGVSGYETVFQDTKEVQESDDTNACDPQGRPFKLPVDSEHKSKVLRIYSFVRPHMMAFHFSWMSFFCSFVAVFAAAPLVPVLREDLGLTKPAVGSAGVAAVTGTVFCRVIMGTVCDTLGPRYGHAFLQLGCAPALFAMALVQGPTGFIICRLFIGFTLATFVATQFWCSVMFTPRIVGLANATSGGWGNLGGGVTQLLMPLVFTAIKQSVVPFLAWRWAFFVPGLAMILIGVGVLFMCQDLPDGQYAELRKAGLMAKASGMMSAWAGMRNYRTWILVVTYGFCFGVELTMNNIITPYFYDQFGLPLNLAGLIGSMFGMMNLFARALGGWLSDLSAKKYGMRGRLWVLWATQTFEGVFCIIMGLLYRSLAATIVVMIMFSLCVQSAEGASYGVVPFVSKRGLGIVSGLVGAGGNTGSVVTQSLFFVTDKYTTYQGIMWMGVMIIAMTQLVCFIWFPMWGGMFFGPKEGANETDYYVADFTQKEKGEGQHEAVLKFANESKSERPAKHRDGEAETPKAEETA